MFGKKLTAFNTLNLILMALVFMGIVIDSIGRSYYLGKWYIAMLVSMYLTVQIICAVWEAKNLHVISHVDLFKTKKRLAICILKSLYVENVV